MDKIVIIGGNELNGSVEISGAKNAVLPVMAATLLVPGEYRISRVPNLRDTRTMIKLLKLIGAEVSFDDGLVTIDTGGCDNPEAPYELVKTMRASFYVLGPLLSRFGYARVSLPGGCAWGPRPVNFHVSAVKALGAETSLEEGYVVAKGEKLYGNTIDFDKSSVGATGNAVMAAVRAEGETVVKNAACEPEIVTLCDFINAMGGQVSGMGSDTIKIRGVESLQAVDFGIIPDRIEAATFLIAGAMIGDTVSVLGVIPDHIAGVIERLNDAGNDITIGTDSVTLKRGEGIRPVVVTK
ncbi:MAG: UDP-N-acetylglucosamine 1-carboxyvinyltransferase [Candidatus Marinimicrobia bacterium]|nr:UDP-N-acetylglucosamine 1-carboxyvinyltransferase [Candidatus Neomarinimicrobiota bacterium]